jgi:hypothetical protein
LDPITAIGIAQASYAAICAGFKHGRELETMAGDIGRWMGAIQTVKTSHEKAKSRRFGSIEEEALETYAAKKKAEKMEDELRNFLISNYGINAWNDVIRIQGQLRKQKLEEQRLRQKRIEEIVNILLISSLICLVGGALVFLLWLTTL